MPVRDIFHDAVKIALEKEGWTITHDPYHVRFGEVDLYLDLGAEKFIAAERADQKIAIEIKMFPSASPVTDFHTALGQFMSYRMALKVEEPGALCIWPFHKMSMMPSLDYPLGSLRFSVMR